MQNSYTFTFDATKPLPYGLWLDIPFRTKGATALRSEAKSRGARFLPNAKKWSWWLPQRRITQDSVNWFNKHNLFRGERKSPVFNSTIKWSDLPHGHQFTVVLRLPYEQKDIAKADGAAWDSISKCWWFNSNHFTESMFDKYAKMQAISTVLARGAANDINFFTEDDGSGTVAAPVAAPAAQTQPMQAFYMDNGQFVIKFLNTKNGDNAVLITIYEDGKPLPGNALHGVRLSVEDARSYWDTFVKSGYKPCQSNL